MKLCGACTLEKLAEMRTKKIVDKVPYSTGDQLFAESQGHDPIAGASYIWFGRLGNPRLKQTSSVTSFKWKPHEKKKNN